VKSDQDGGAHYISYFKATDGSWYYYDDLREDIVQIVSLPDKVWNESSGSMPAMYFYQIVEK
jgi:ubiquitin C-terminal hydrolase